MTLTRRDLMSAMLLAAAGSARAQAPDGLGPGPVRIIGSLPTGSGPDTVARLVAEKLQARWGRTVIVDARPGGAGAVAVNAIKTQPPTGNDLCVADVGTLVVNPLVFKKLSYDPQQDLVPVAVMFRTTFFVTVAADGRIKTAADWLAAIQASTKDKPIKYGSNAVAGPIHLASAQIESALGRDMVHVPFKETTQLYQAVSTGEIDWALGSLATTRPLVQAGRLRVIAVPDVQRSAAAPDIPTLAEVGGPKNVVASSWNALMAPKGTPPALAAEINRAVQDAMATPEMRERLAQFAFQPTPGTPQLVSELMSADRARYIDVIKRLNVSLD